MKILFGADISFHYFCSFPEEERAKKAMMEPAALFAEADFGMVNLENIFGVKEKETPIVKSGPNLISDAAFAAYVDAIKPTVIGMANNHTRDFGDGPMLETMEVLREKGYRCIGAGKNIADAYAPAILEKDGVKVAIFAVCENEFGIAEEKRAGTAGYRLGRVSAAIGRALKDGCKPIVYFHGGNEYNPFPSPGKVELYRHFIDLGAEAVIAMHTHCPQGYEYYEGKPIVYSMGNLFFPTATSKHKSWKYGYLSEIDLSKEGIQLSVHPYTFDFDGITMLKGEEKEAMLNYIAYISTPIKDAGKIQSLFDSWCLTPAYIHHVAGFNDPTMADGLAEVVKHVKNVFGCEAHNELMTNTFMMLYQSRIEQARALLPEILTLQNMEIPR